MSENDEAGEWRKRKYGALAVRVLRCDSEQECRRYGEHCNCRRGCFVDGATCEQSTAFFYCFNWYDLTQRGHRLSLINCFCIGVANFAGNNNRLWIGNKCWKRERERENSPTVAAFNLISTFQLIQWSILHHFQLAREGEGCPWLCAFAHSCLNWSLFTRFSLPSLFFTLISIISVLWYRTPLARRLLLDSVIKG